MLFLLMCFAYGAYYRSLIAKYRLQLQRDSAENVNLAQQLIRVQEGQIHHIARELHDGFGQTLKA